MMKASLSSDFVAPSATYKKIDHSLNYPQKNQT
jgi:hypothetical protein